jgi:hypothetical protein
VVVASMTTSGPHVAFAFGVTMQSWHAAGRPATAVTMSLYVVFAGLLNAAWSVAMFAALHGFWIAAGAFQPMSASIWAEVTGVVSGQVVGSVPLEPLELDVLPPLDDVLPPELDVLPPLDDVLPPELDVLPPLDDEELDVCPLEELLERPGCPPSGSAFAMSFSGSVTVEVQAKTVSAVRTVPTRTAEERFCIEAPESKRTGRRSPRASWRRTSLDGRPLVSFNHRWRF